MNVRVGVDATGWDNRRGFGRFTRNAVAALVERQGLTVELFVDETAEASSLPAGVTVGRVRSGSNGSEAAAAGSRRRLVDLARAGAAVRSAPIDVLLFPSLHTWFPARGVPSVVGVHDAIARRAPHETLGGALPRLAWTLKERAAIRTATRVFTVSNAARLDIAEAFGIDPEVIAVVPEAPDPGLAAPDRVVGASLVARLGLAPGGYVLCAPGGLAAHKGVDTVLAAHASLRALRDDVPPLVVVGALDDEAYHSVAGAVRSAVADLPVGTVILPGYVDDPTLAALYAGALLVVNASRAEGFGLPAVEAAAAGAPVVLGDIPAHRETLGDAAVFFPAGDAEALAAEVGRLLDDPALRDEVGERCRAAVGSLTWAAAGEKLGALLEEVGRGV